MDGRPVRRRRRDATENRERILRAADLVLRERGAQARMEDVIAAAGVGKGTLYRNFPSRAALAEALLDGLSRDLQRRVLTEVASGNGPAVNRLEAFMGMAAAFVADNLDLLCLAREDRRDDPRLSPPYVWQRMVVAALLAEAARSGARDGPGSPLLPDTIIGLIEPGLVRHAMDTLGMDRAAVMAEARRAARGLATTG